MKHKFTKLMAVITVLLFSVWNVNAADVELYFTSSQSSSPATYSTGDMLYATATSSSSACSPASFRTGSINGTVLYLVNTSASKIIIKGNSSGSTSSRTISKIEKSANNTDWTDITSALTISGSLVGTSCNSVTIDGLAITTGTYLKFTWKEGNVQYSVFTITPMAAAAPTITEFVASGVSATIDQNAKTITAELPYGTNLASIEPVVTIGGTATSYGPPGAQDFSNSVTVPVVYTVSDGVNEVDYSVTLTASQTPSSEKDLSNVMIGGKTPTFDAGTNTYSITLPKAYDITSQVVTFTKPGTATANFTSGATHDFTNPLQITVTAQDASTKVYTLTAQAGIADIAYVSTAATPHANDTKIYPMLLEKGYYVNVIAASGTDLTQFNPYDLVVLCENVSSSNTLALAMNGLIKSKRFLNFKAFMYNKTGWPTGTPSDGSSDADIAIATDYISHPIFSGVSISGNIANILTDPAVKGVQGVLNPASSSVIANLTSTGNTDKVAIIENNQMPTAKYMLIPIQTDSYSKVNANGLKLIENAITYLLTDSKFGPYTGSANINKTNIIFDGRTIQNPDRQQLHVFDATGRIIVTSQEDINMSAHAKGVYLVKGENGMMKIALTK